MEKQNDYLPHFFDKDGNKFDVLSMDFCIDFGGRQCQIECQRNNDDGTYPIKDFTIFYLSGVFSQRSSEQICDSDPVKCKFYDCVMQIFKVFQE